MKNFRKIVSFFFCVAAFAISDCRAEALEANFTIASYNCGGLADHYDYVRAAAMQHVMQERYIKESENLAKLDRLMELKVKLVFAPTDQKKEALKVWEKEHYDYFADILTRAPGEADSPNTYWYDRVNEVITTYNIRPIKILNNTLKHIFKEHIKDLNGHESKEDALTIVYKKMAKRIFRNDMKFDIICLQEADFLDNSLFPRHYQFMTCDSEFSKNGFAWREDRFELLASCDLDGKAMVAKFHDKKSNKVIAVASAHLTGSNPYTPQYDSEGNTDCRKGDEQLLKVLAFLDEIDADICLIGMDANVTALHPRLSLLKNALYQIDYKNHLEPTCASPHQVINGRIDWIGGKALSDTTLTLVNIPVLSVHLNSLRTNMSDHKPIAASIRYTYTDNENRG